MSKQFVSCHNHTEVGSILDGMNDVNLLFERAKNLEHPALAITDHGTMTAHIDAYKASQKTGVKLIPGCEIYFAPNPELKKSNHMVLLPKNQQGYKDLLNINFEAYKNQVSGYMGKMTPRISWEHLEGKTDNLFCLTACANGILSKDIVLGNESVAIENTKKLQSYFGDRLFLEIQPHKLFDEGKVDQQKVNETLIKFSRDLGVGFTATCDAHYLDRDHAKYHDMMLAIKEKAALNDPNRFKYGVQDMYLKDASELYDFWGHDIASIAIKNSLIIASACEEPHYLKGGKPIFAIFPVKEQPDYEKFKNWWQENCEELPGDKAYLRFKCIEGFKNKIHLSKEKRDIYWNRVKYELSILEMRNFSSYMLIVADYVLWAQKNGITTGVARGSAAGSLVAFLIGITKVDPIKYDLLFERFHNKEKKSFPDIDCDFSDPDAVKDYLKRKYGEQFVAQISNWSCLTPKVIVKDVSRTLEIGGDKSTAFKIANDITASFPDEETIEECIKKSKEVAKFMQEYPEVRKYSEKLQGLTRQMSVHAAGVVIADQPLHEIVPLRIEKDSKTGKETVVTQWEKTRVEEFGLIKMDILGLTTLSVIDSTLKLIKKTKGEDIDIDHIPLDDSSVYKMISKGDNIGVFQLESSLSPLCMKIKPENIGAISDINALGRPSCPPEQRNSYINRKFGQEPIDFSHSNTERALKNTFGISLYEESMMTIARDCAGWDLNEADNLRKLTKLKGKDPEMVKRTEDKFVKDCMSYSGMTEKQARHVWQKEISAFGGYGFNKSLLFSEKVDVIQNGEKVTKIIKDIIPGDKVFSRCEKTGKSILVEVKANHYHGKLDVYKITLESGKEVFCTKNHKFRTEQGLMIPIEDIVKNELSIVERDYHDA